MSKIPDENGGGRMGMTSTTFPSTLRLNLLRIDRVSVAICRLVRSYTCTFERPSWRGTSWKSTGGQGPAIRPRQVLDRQGFLCVYVFAHPQCHVEAECHFCYLMLSGQPAPPPLPMWDVDGSAMVPLPSVVAVFRDN
jgi:hypothetical protein